MKKRRVAITGIGLITSGHHMAGDLFDTLRAGGSLIEEDKTLAAHGVPGIPSGALRNDQRAWLEETYPQIRNGRTGLAGKMIFHSMAQALEQAGLAGRHFSLGQGLFIGINKNLISLSHIRSMAARYDEASASLVPGSFTSHQDMNLLRPDQVVEPLIREMNFGGAVQVHSDACAAGASAVVSGFRQIAEGRLDRALCGAAEHGSDPIMQLMFSRLGALCRKRYPKASEASRPFDKDRSGCVLSDASAVLVLEEETKALERGAEILAYISGASRLCEAHHITSSDPGGSYYARTMAFALDDAGVTPERVDHINAHGTSTISNDEAESHAIHELFHDRPSVTSTKSALGHSLATSGVMELALSVLSLNRQEVLPTLNYREPRPSEPRINIVREGEGQSLGCILSNSFGFGGENVSIVLTGKDV